MSGFDGMARSQAQASQASQFYDAQRYDSMRGTGQAIQQTGAQIIGDMQTNRALGQRDRAMDMQQMQFAVEVQQLATEQAMRVQEHEINMQQSMAKLQAMDMMNNSDMLRQQVRGAKLQNDAMEAENAQRADMYKSSKKESAEQTRARLIAAMGGAEGLLIHGYDENFNRITDEKELEKRMERAKELRGNRYINENVEIKRLQNEWTAAERAFNDALDSGAPPEVLDQLHAVKDQLRNGYMQARGITVGGGGASKPQAPKLSDDQRTLSESIRERLKSTMDTERTRLLQESSAHQFSGQIPTLPDGADQKIADYLASKSEEYRVRQQKGYDADPERKGLVATHASAVEEILAILSNMRDKRRQALLAELKQRGVL